MLVPMVLTLLNLAACEGCNCDEDGGPNPPQVFPGTNGYMQILDGSGNWIGELQVTAEPNVVPPSPWIANRGYWFWNDPSNAFPSAFSLGPKTVGYSPRTSWTVTLGEMPFPPVPPPPTVWAPNPQPNRAWEIRRGACTGPLLGALYHFGNNAAVTEQHWLGPNGPNITSDGWFNMANNNTLCFNKIQPVAPADAWRHIQTFPIP
jgi:hypothetical protein